MRIYPAPHYTMGGLWVDYHLMTTITGCSRAERRTSPTMARTGSWSALMQAWPMATSSFPIRSLITSPSIRWMP